MIRAPVLREQLRRRRAERALERPGPGIPAAVIRAFGVVPVRPAPDREPDPEVVAAIEAFRAACESPRRVRARGDGLPPDPACRAALAALPALERVLREGDAAAAYEALRPLGRALKPKPQPIAAE